jgi:hypothetical protein
VLLALWADIKRPRRRPWRTFAKLAPSASRYCWTWLIWYTVPTDARDRRDVAKEIEAELIIERGVDRVRRTHQEERIAVCRRAHDRLGADVGASTWSVFDKELLAQPLRQPLTH